MNGSGKDSLKMRLSRSIKRSETVNAINSVRKRSISGIEKTSSSGDEQHKDVSILLTRTISHFAYDMKMH